MSVSVEASGREDQAVKTITVTVNGHAVVFHQHQATGAQIKTAAIAQHVPNIEPDFVLFEKKGPNHQDQIGDGQTVNLHEGQTFRALAPDDNS